MQFRRTKGQKSKRYSTWDSHVVTHRITNQAISCLNMADLTGCLAFNCLWPYLLKDACSNNMLVSFSVHTLARRPIVLCTKNLFSLFTPLGRRLNLKLRCFPLAVAQRTIAVRACSLDAGFYVQDF
ncbi:hypothetical protein BDZ85DRAFT_115370 [Elsinoe ampelina]|uniref:Uncharacterized protein n=1 Tax=Elsinoe ampelina TaxID=302913 RepID=A0A6A6GDZ1_9PEZI|nr:hypothetical protein BDZ85DRAFT_115370 [Elsinoe ampelina]